MIPIKRTEQEQQYQQEYQQEEESYQEYQQEAEQAVSAAYEKDMNLSWYSHFSRIFLRSAVLFHQLGTNLV